MNHIVQTSVIFIMKTQWNYETSNDCVNKNYKQSRLQILALNCFRSFSLYRQFFIVWSEIYLATKMQGNKQSASGKIIKFLKHKEERKRIISWESGNIV